MAARLVSLPAMVRPLSAAIAAMMIAGCGSREHRDDSTLRFRKIEERTDTAGLSRGRTLLQSFAVVRDPAGALRAEGRLGLPEGTVLELIVYAARGAEVRGRTQFILHDGRFESPPILGPGGPLPEGTYHFQLRARFDPELQPAEVMNAVDGGLALRGPGIMQIGSGMVAFVHDLVARR
jgi:hypothetical protein